VNRKVDTVPPRMSEEKLSGEPKKGGALPPK
jgi:hypothetical protein